MRVAVVTVALRIPTDRSRWITVPPQGYSGIHWVVTHLLDGLLDLGHEVYLLGAPGSPQSHPNLTIVPTGEPEDTYSWLRTADIDIVHDHSCGQLEADAIWPTHPYVTTHHLTGRGKHPQTCVYLSEAHRRSAGSSAAPVVRIPVNPSRYHFQAEKEDYLLFLGRISAFKGAYEAAAFAHAAGRRILLAGPSWEPEYLEEIQHDFRNTVEVVGEVGGRRRLELLAGATAVLATSQSVMGPWGAVWCEPGSTVVSEAAASGTPVIGTSNGCLAEIVPPVGVVIPEGRNMTPEIARKALAELPSPSHVLAEARKRWDHREIAREYVTVYQSVINGRSWT